MKVGILNLEPKYKNLALEKCRIYYKNRGDRVLSDFISDGLDLIYCSSIFDFTDKNGRVPYNAICGGTGFNLSVKLPKEIDEIKPHLNFGFTTRGCIRKCKFCVVPLKEGVIRIEGDLLDLWDGGTSDIVLYDNNILALPEHFAFICEQAREYRIRLDFNQGLDHRLLTPELVDILKSIRHHEYRFAFDNTKSIKTVDKAITLLQSKGINRCSWYVLVGFDSTLEDDLFRLNHLRERNQNAFVQRFQGKQEPRIKRNPLELQALSRWANQHHIFQGMTWEQFCEHPDNKRYVFN